MRRAPTTALIALSTALAGSGPSTRSQVAAWPANLLRISVLVTGESGKPATGLRQSDFEVTVDGQPAPIEGFTPEPADLVVAVLVDITSSLHENPAGVAGLVSGTRAGSGAALPSAMHPEFIPPAVEPFDLKGTRAGDRVRIGAITRMPALGPVIDGASPEVGKQWKALFDLPPVEWLGPSPIFDAVSDAVTALASSPGQRAVILMTDGLASGNRKGYRDVAAEAALSGVSVSIVAQPPVPPQIVTPTRDPMIPLQVLADATGGLYILEEVATYRGTLGEGAHWAAGQRAKSFERVLDHLHRGYAIGIATLIDGRLHRLKVKVRRPGAKVSAARGYFRK